MAKFFLRLVGAATFDPRTYEDVEADQRATPQSLAVILLASLAAGIGASGWSPDAEHVLALSAGTATMALLAWIAWALLTFEIGSRLLPESETRVDVGELLRTLGFSAAPGLFLVFGLFPNMTTPVFALTAVWMLATMVMALRQALDYTSTLRALGVCGVGWLLALAFIIVFALFSSPVVSAQGAPVSPPQLPAAAPVYDGGQLFKNHCAPCHGVRGLGDGPMSEVMRKRPANLTKFSAQNGGVFPAERLRRIIDGRGVPSHGDREMPVWGIAFRTIPEGGVYGSIEARIDALVRYLQAIQERAAQ